MSDARVAVVIEDDLDARELTQLVLTQSGFTVIAAPDGLAGIEAVRRHDPILTTLDVQMPGMDGFAVAKRLREFSLTYLIMITSMASEVDLIQGFEAGADDYLVKPFRPRELRARADSMLRRPRDRGTVANSAPPETSWAAQLARELGENPLPPIEGLQMVDTPQDPPAPADPPGLAPTKARGRLAMPGGMLPTSAPGRIAIGSASAEQSPDAVFNVAGLSLDSRSGRASLDGRALHLNAAEFGLLSTLMRTGHRVRSRADLVLALRGQSHVTSHFVNEADKRIVDGHVATLKAKLGDVAEAAGLIEVIPSVGYRMVTS